MFKSTGLFAEVSCPEGPKCPLSFCIFNHDPVDSAADLGKAKLSVTTKRGHDDIEVGRPLKKQRVDDDDLEIVSPLPKTKAISSSTVSFSQTKNPGQAILLSAKRTISPPARQSSVSKRASPGPLKAHASLPPKPPSKSSETQTKAPQSLKTNPSVPIIEQLVPRKLGKAPVAFPTRLQLCKLLYAEYIRLEKLLQDSKEPSKSALSLTKQEMVTMVLDEEEKTAKEQTSVYANVVKLRIQKLRNMKTLQPWKEERLKQIAIANPQPEAPPEPSKPKRVKTGLTQQEEIALLPHMLTPIDALAPHGYVPKPPSEGEIREALRIVEMAKNWEYCDRCEGRFQVFPQRRESDGVLTTGGACKYHWGRRRQPPKTPGTSSRPEASWSCCGKDMTSEPCAHAKSHVFKVQDHNRLASIMQFKETQTPGPEVPQNAVAFDCEMGYTSVGLELIRLTATSWPSGAELVDVLVRPIGEVIDLNSRFSGVWPEDWLNAVPYDEPKKDGAKDDKAGTIAPAAKKRKTEEGQTEEVPAKEPLKMVASPQRARELLFEHLTTTTPLIGHALDNDLNSVRICHPAIVDTVILFPANRPLPIRMGLKVLAKKHLGMDIQMGGERGHDSKEDANAAGELVRFKLRGQWSEMKLRGWKADKGRIVPPVSN